MEELSKHVKALYEARNNLKNSALNNNLRWRFTLDGNLIGDIGELIACNLFDLTPLNHGAKTHDAQSKEGKMVQIKATQRDSVGLGIIKRNFDFLIVIRINEDGNHEIVYNGPGENIWRNTNSLSISINKLRELNKAVPQSQKVK